MHLPLKITVITVIIIITFITAPKKIGAVTNPQAGSVGVTATIPATPDTPVLIAPGNNALISTTAPSFIFNPSLGTAVINHYELWLDGNKNTYPIGQSLNTIITQAKTALAEGSHTWFIKAVANSGTERNSTTWAFTIDTTAPLILVNQVAEHETSLSSLDLSPWKKEVKFSTADRKPAISGQSEAGATLTISFNDASVTIPVGSDRLFNVKPATSLNPGRYTVTVTSSDPAGNTTTLPAFYIDIVAGSAPLTINLPSPLPNLSFVIPVRIPETLFPVTALEIVPTAAEPINYLVWLIITAYLCHIYCLNQMIHRLYLHHHIKTYHFILLYITIILPTLLLAFIARASSHWLPLILALLSLFIMITEHKLIRSKHIKIEQG